MKRVLLTLATVGLLGGSCMSMGCAYTHTQTGTSHFRPQIAGVGGVDDEAALSADITFDDYTFEFRGDPLALGLRVVQDVKTFIGSLFPAGS